MKMMIKIVMSVIGALSAVSVPTVVSAVELVSLVTDKAGMYRISYSELAAAGVDLQGVKHRKLALTRGGQPIGIRTRGQMQGKKAFFGAGGYIEFYAPAADSLYTDEVVVTLHLDRGKRLDMPTEALKFNKKAGSGSTYQREVIIEENRRYDYLAPSGTDPWHYGQIFGAGYRQGPTYNFTLDGIPDGTAAALDVEVYGIVDVAGEGNDHHYEILVNDQVAGDQQFEGVAIDMLSTDGVAIHDGDNTLRIDLKGIAGMPFDALALNRFMLRFDAPATASGGYLEGEFAPGQTVVTGFIAGDGIEIYRREADNTVTRLRGDKPLGEIDGSFANGINAGLTGGYFYLVAEGAYRQPSVRVLPDQAEITAGDAEYLILTHAAFLGEHLETLVQLRQADYSVKVVDVAQVFAQFGDHVPSADAIHAYIKYAAANLGTRFVTLVGTDTYDYKGYVSNSISFVPTRYVSTPGGGLTISQTPSDAKYGDLDGDDVPDIPIGRLTVRTPEELGFVVEKIRDYQSRSGYAGRILIAADKEDVGNGVNFTDDAAALISVIPQEDWRNAVLGPNRDGFRAYPDVDGDAVAKAKIGTAVEAGVSVLQYIGHSSQQAWGRTTPTLLLASEISAMNNIDKPVLVTQWGCWNTYFVAPAGNSMGDAFLVGGLNGAVTVLGASTLTTSHGERALGIELNKRMYQPGLTIGEAVIQAKQALARTSPDALDILLGWQILGDPALRVNP